LNTVGIVGGGQLGQMLGYAAAKLGIDCVFIDPSDDPPAASAGRVIHAAYDDERALRELASLVDVITYEFENVPVAAMRRIAQHCDVYPPADALECAQDRILEKQLFESLSIPVAGFAAVDSADDLRAAAELLGLPLVVKTRRFGYDGKGQAILHDIGDADSITEQLGGGKLIAEQFIPFEREVSIIGVRSILGNTVSYPLSENRHADGILRESRAPAGNGALGRTAARYLERLMSELDYVGTLALELFAAGGRLLANEMAPRVHNSGHWTIEGCDASQFENHIRAITGVPLVDPTLNGFPGMVNIIGNMPCDAKAIDAAGGVVHDYGKTPRPARKLGHITVIGASTEDRDARISRLDAALVDA